VATGGSSVAAPEVRETETNIESPRPATPPVDSRTEPAPVNLETTETALNRFLNEMADLRESAMSAINAMGPWAWILLSLAAFTVVEELVRRRWRHVQAKKNRAASPSPELRERFPGLFDPQDRV